MPPMGKDEFCHACSDESLAEKKATMDRQIMDRFRELPANFFEWYAAVLREIEDRKKSK